MSVFIARADKGIRDPIEKIIHRFLNPDDLNRGVFLKPNIVFPVKDRAGEITRLVVVEQIILALRAMKIDVNIVIGEGVAAGADAQENFRVSGFIELALKLGVPLVDLENVERTEVDWKYGKLSLPVMTLNRTYISLPILKLNSAAGISGAMKNQKGLVRHAMKKQFHRMGLHEPLFELNKIVQPRLTIVDCRNYFKGPLFIAGANAIEVDSHIVSLLGVMPPENVRLAGIQQPFSVEGDAPYQPRGKHQRLNRPFRRFLRLRLWAGAGACSMCRRRITEIKSPAILFSFSGLLTALKLFSYMVTGADIIIGSDARPIKDSRRLICFGECTKKSSDKTGRFVPGCPPSIQSLNRYL